MGISETLKMIVTADTAGASSAFQKLGANAEKDLGKAEKGTSKIDTAMGTLKANAVPIVGAIVVGMAKLGMSFADQAIAAGKFATQTGLTVEQASGLTNVADDLGVSTEALGKSMNLMLKAAGNTPEKFQELGVAIAYTNTGAVDSQGTFLAVIDRLKAIKDPAERAATGAKLLGKGWAEAAPLIDEGSASLLAMVAATPKGDIFHQSDVDSAKKMKAAINDVKDQAQALGNAIGKEVVPRITEAATELTTMVKIANMVPGGGLVHVLGTAADWTSLAGPIKLIASHVNEVKDAIVTTTLGVEKGGMETLALQAYNLANGTNVAAGSVNLFTPAMDKLNAATQANADKTTFVADVQAGFKKAVDDSTAATKAHEKAVDADNKALQTEADLLKGEAEALLAQADAMRSAADHNYALRDAGDAYNQHLTDLKKTIKDAKGDQDLINAAYREGATLAASVANAAVQLAQDNATATGATYTATQQQDTWNQTMLFAANQAGPKQRAEILLYIAQANGIPESKVTEIQALMDKGLFAEALAEITGLSKPRQADVIADAKTAQAKIDLDNIVKPREVPITAKFIGNVPASWQNGNDPRYPQRAGGGPVQAGKPVIVGEDGWEVFTPAANGMIVNQSQLNVSTVTTGGTPPPATPLPGTGISDEVDAAIKEQDRLQAAMYRTGRESLVDYQAYVRGRLATSKDLSDDYVSQYDLLQRLADTQKSAEEASQAEVDRQSKELADRLEQQAKDAADRLEKQTKELADRLEQQAKDAAATIQGIYTDAQNARNQALDEAQQQADYANVGAVGGAGAAIQNDPKASDADKAQAVQNLINAETKLADDAYRNTLAKAAKARLDTGTIEWDRFMRTSLEGTIAGYAGLDVTTDALKSYLSGIPALAKGGRYQAGVPRIVGEDGWELDIPDHSGTIVPRNKLGAGNVTNIINVTKSDASAADIARELTWGYKVGVFH